MKRPQGLKKLFAMPKNFKGIVTAYLVIAAVPVYTFFLREYAAYRKRMLSAP